jgi:Flp pilus assembly protein TadG
LPLVCLCLTALLGLIAMAMDLGLLMMARSQAQSAADTAALAGARSLIGNQATNNNKSGASTNAMNIATTNSILGQQIASGQVTPINIGDYYYNYSTGAFVIYPSSLGDPTDNYNLVQVTVTFNQNASFFAPIFFGMNGWNTQAMATAAHRPRDVVIVQDFSGHHHLGRAADRQLLLLRHRRAGEHHAGIHCRAQQLRQHPRRRPVDAEDQEHERGGLRQ